MQDNKCDLLSILLNNKKKRGFMGEDDTWQVWGQNNDSIMP